MNIRVIKMEKSKPRKNVKALVKKGIAEEYGSVDTKPKVFVEPENKYSKQLEEKKKMKRLREKQKAKEKPHLNKKLVAQKKMLKEGAVPTIEESEEEMMEETDEMEEETEEIEDEESTEQTSPLVKEVEEDLKYKME